MGGVAVLAVALAAVGASALRHGAGGPDGCDPEPRVAGDAVPRVLTTGPRPAGADHRLGRLVTAARAWGLGEVAGALGYDYGTYLSLAAVPGGLAAWTKDNADVAFLDRSLRARWGIAQDKGQHAYDVADGRWLQLRLPAHGPLQISARSLDDGHLAWCRTVGTVPTRYGDPLGTAVLPGGDVVVLTDDPAGARVTRLAAGDGGTRWSRAVAAPAADGLTVTGHAVVVGGRASYDLGGTASADVLRWLDPATGRTRHRWAAPGALHVVGSDGPRLVVEQAGPSGLVLRSLDPTGRVRWRRPAPTGTQPDIALRAGVLVLRTDRALLGLDASTGRRRWRVPIPAGRQYLPYGFQLDAAPMLDATHLLLGTTTAVVSLGLGSGGRTAYPLPRHGIDTTYWPAQVVVADGLLGVVTHTGTVVLRR